MAVVWPVALGMQSPTLVNFTETGADNLIRTQMDTGPPKVRRRSTAGVRNVTLRVMVTSDEIKNTLDDWFETSLLHGSLEWEWEVPWDSANQVYILRMTSPLRYVPLGASNWEVFMTAEVLRLEAA